MLQKEEVLFRKCDVLPLAVGDRGFVTFDVIDFTEMHKAGSNRSPLQAINICYFSWLMEG